MSARSDRGIPGNGTLVAVAAVLMLLGASGFVLWWRVSALHLEQASRTVAAARGPQVPAGPVDAPVPMTLYLPAGELLSVSTAQIKRQADGQSQAREIVSALLADERQGKGPVLGNMKLRELYLDGSGTAYVDISPSGASGLRSSVRDELLAVYSLVDTVMRNVEEVKRVRFLVDGKDAPTLAGHIDLTRSFTMRMDLVKE